MPKPRDLVCAAFGQRVRDLRRQRKLSQERLAALAGLHRTYIGGIERGERNPSLTIIVRIGDALGVGAAGLFCGPPFAPADPVGG